MMNQPPRSGILCPNCVWIPAVGIALLTIIFRNTDIDLIAARSLFNYDAMRWLGRDVWLWETIYDSAPLLGGIFVTLGSVLTIAGIYSRKFDQQTRLGIYLLLTLAIGPGVIVNGVLKNHWGRPRPRQLVEFGGDMQFVPVGEPGTVDYNSSFPSGHAAIAFYLLTPGFYFLKRGQVRTSAIVFSCGLAYGGLVGFARMMEGGHFLSDVIWAGTIVYFCALVCAPVLTMQWPFQTELVHQQDRQKNVRSMELTTTI